MIRNPIILFSCLFALALGALSPHGFMPGITKDGLAIVPCSGYGSMVSGAASTHESHHDDGSDHGSSHHDDSHENMTNLCSFAVAAGGDHDTSPQIELSAPKIAPAYAAGEQKRFAVRNRINIPPATGPPALL